MEIYIVCKSGVVYIQLGTISKQCLLDFSHHVAKSLLEMYPFKTEAHPRRMRLWCGSYRPLSLKREKTPPNKQQEGSSYTNQFSPFISICSEGEMHGVVVLLVESSSQGKVTAI